jgi:hypothetical protein
MTDPGCEDLVRSVISLQPHCMTSVSDEIMRRILIIRERCIQAEKEESVDGLSSWRRSHQKISKSKYNDSSSKNFRWKPAQALPEGQGQGHPQKQEQGHPQRYVSKFKNTSVPVEDTILNQVILNKLNKFSVTNYDEIKSFLQQILDSDDSFFLKDFMQLVFKKAATEPTFCPLYARMISELGSEYETLRSELKILYEDYLVIFEEVSEETCKDYDEFIKRSKEKVHRLGYSQFLAELVLRGSLGVEDIKRIFIKILEQIKLHGQVGEAKHQLIEEYADCLLQMSKAFKVAKPHLTIIRQELHVVCVNFMDDFLRNRVEKYPGISKKASFSFMDCLDIFKPSIPRN